MACEALPARTADMRAVVQRVLRASVDVGTERIAAIGSGILVLVGIADGDTRKDMEYIVRKCLGLRIFDDADGQMNMSVEDLGLEVLVVSQFTLMGDVRHGRRPSYANAGTVEQARAIFDELSNIFRSSGAKVSFGRFQANMNVDLVNSGPVTILLDSRKEF